MPETIPTKQPNMNLEHRMADTAGFRLGSLPIRFHKIEYPFTLALPALATFLNFWSVRPFFGQTWDVGSVSAVFVPLLGSFVARLTENNGLMAVFILLAYGFGGLAFYFFIFTACKRHLTAYLGALLSILPPAFFSQNVPPRLTLALLERDGAHVAGLTLIAVALIFFFNFIREGKKLDLKLFVLLGTATSLVSFFSVFILFIYMLFICISEVLLGYGKIKLERFMQCVLWLGGVILLLYNVAIVKLLLTDDGQQMLSYLNNFFPLLFVIVPVAGIFVFLIFDRRPLLQPLFLAATFSLFNAVSIFASDLASFSARRFDAEQAFTVSFLLALAITWIFDFVRGGIFLKRFPQLFINRTRIAFATTLALLVLLTGSAMFIERTL